jgi:hypothetical protein
LALGELLGGAGGDGVGVCGELGAGDSHYCDVEAAQVLVLASVAFEPEAGGVVPQSVDLDREAVRGPEEVDFVAGDRGVDLGQGDLAARSSASIRSSASERVVVVPSRSRCSSAASRARP